MTSEERFQKIENAIHDLIIVSRTTLNAIDELRAAHDELRAAHKDLQAGQKELQEAQKVTEEKLHILIDTVDRIIRNQQK